MMEMSINDDPNENIPHFISQSSVRESWQERRNHIKLCFAKNLIDYNLAFEHELSISEWSSKSQKRFRIPKKA
jgi:hypothetical protein